MRKLTVKGCNLKTEGRSKRTSVSKEKCVRSSYFVSVQSDKQELFISEVRQHSRNLKFAHLKVF